jgi:hypothetical protein
MVGLLSLTGLPNVRANADGPAVFMRMPLAATIAASIARTIMMRLAVLQTARPGRAV